MKLLITAGPTREPIDPVRFMSNRSSGKMGYALAAAGVARGHAVTLISGPTALPPPTGVRLVSVMTTAEMAAAVQREFDACDVLIMAAAPADWRPATVAGQKIKKDGHPRTLALEPTEDILSAVSGRKGDRILVGFAAETRNLLDEARGKLARKRLDLIVANDVSASDAGFGTDCNRVTIIDRQGGETSVPLLPKVEIAKIILERVEDGVKKK